MADDIPLSQLTREQLYERLRKESRDALMLAEMQRLGLWPADSPQFPDELTALIQQEGELVRQLNALQRQLAEVQDPQAALRAMRRERMAAAKARREETRRKRNAERQQRALDWHQRRSQDIGYLGAGVSQALHDTDTQAERLTRNGLPLLTSALPLATAMGISLEELRFLSFHRTVSRISHYQRFQVPKKTGGTRLISAPMPRLKRAQYWILDNLLARLPVHDAAHGFVRGRSIVSNAQPHVGQAVVINLDLKDFFPSIEFPRIRGLWRSLGFSGQVATILALLTTEAPTDQVEIDGAKLHVARQPRCLPQGAPTSPALTNQLCRSLDRRLAACARKLGFHYTRYADDLTFSADAAAAGRVGKLLWRAHQILAAEGYQPHPAKQRVMRASQRQEVTGIVVNQQPAVNRESLKRLRATLFQVERDGPAGKHWNGNPNVVPALIGYARFVHMVDPAKGAPLLERALRLQARYPATATPPAAHPDFRALAARGQAPWSPWWNAQAAPAPTLEVTAEQIKETRKAAKINLQKAESATPGPKSARTPATVPPPSREHLDGEIRPPLVLPWLDRPVPWRSALAQLILALVAAAVFHKVALFMLGVVLVSLTIAIRRPNWILFVVSMMLVHSVVPDYEPKAKPDKIKRPGQSKTTQT